MNESRRPVHRTEFPSKSDSPVENSLDDPLGPRPTLDLGSSHPTPNSNVSPSERNCTSALEGAALTGTRVPAEGAAPVETPQLEPGHAGRAPLLSKIRRELNPSDRTGEPSTPGATDVLNPRCPEFRLRRPSYPPNLLQDRAKYSYMFCVARPPRSGRHLFS